MFAELYKKLFPNKQKIVDDVRVKSRHETMTESLEYSRRMLGKRFSPRVAQITNLETITSNILQFNTELRRINRILENEEKLKPGDAIFDYKETTLARFFIDEATNSYINQSEFRTFYELATKFTELTKEGSTAEYGRHEHNYRVLTKVIRSIIQICTAIGDATK